MASDEKNFKDIIIPKIQTATTTLVNNNHSRVFISDFTSIKKKKIGQYYIFFNKTYKNVSDITINIYFISEESFEFFQRGRRH
jgi:hypothetical protein